MKKALTLILMVGAVIVMSSVAMAQLDQNVIQVNANVAPYAEITPAGGPLNLGAFTGEANEEKTDGTGSFEVETNTILNLLFDFSLSHETEGTPLITYFKIYKNTTGGWLTQPDDTFVPPPASFSAQAEKTTKTYSVTIKAKTGAISDQAAGNYTGTITLTAVSSP